MGKEKEEKVVCMRCDQETDVLYPVDSEDRSCSSKEYCRLVCVHCVEY